MAYDRLLAPGLFSFLSYYQSNIINLFNRSTALSRCVGAGRAGRLFCSLKIAGAACGGCKCALQRRDGSVGVPLNRSLLTHFNAPRKGFNGYHRAIDVDKLGFNINHYTIDDNPKVINCNHKSLN